MSQFRQPMLNMVYSVTYKYMKMFQFSFKYVLETDKVPKRTTSVLQLSVAIITRRECR